MNGEPIRANQAVQSSEKVGKHIAVGSNVYGPFPQLSNYQGKPTTVQTKIIVMWELSKRYADGDFEGQRMLHAEIWTLSMGKKSKARPIIEAWFDKEFSDAEASEFDFREIRGKPCLLQIGLNENGKTRLKSLMSLPDGMESLKTEQSADFVPEWVTTFIKKCKDEVAAWASEKNAVTAQDEQASRSSDGFDDDIPF
jgi:hypothetical protein